MKVYFKNSNGKEMLIGNATNNDEAYGIIKKFCSERDFTIYYTRQWVDSDNLKRTWYDVGSHTEFFIIEED